MNDVALLTVDKSFPVGVSIDEAKLFGGELVGERGGLSAVAVGVVGAAQTVLSGILFFLAGMAIRNKLLIG
ncbi:hypothetical protein [Croceicoccus marinus]|uniref:hypothetical protein n=1 Tax=Croceicoccus marinus TaxID=450378 RepID=UPI0012FBA386|nr:hypothetical protein [Croceicoccus marinus]